MYIFVYMYGLPKSLEKKWRAFILPSWAIAEGPGTRPWVTPQVVVPDIYMYILRIHKHIYVYYTHTHIYVYYTHVQYI